MQKRRSDTTCEKRYKTDQGCIVNRTKRYDFFRDWNDQVPDTNPKQPCIESPFFSEKA